MISRERRDLPDREEIAPNQEIRTAYLEVNVSLSDAKRMLQWKVITEALKAADVGQELIDLVESAQNVHATAQMMATGLLGGADQTQAKNYIKVDMVGMTPAVRSRVRRAGTAGWKNEPRAERAAARSSGVHSFGDQVET